MWDEVGMRLIVLSWRFTLFLYYFLNKFLMNLFRTQYFPFLIARSCSLLQFQVWFFLMFSLWSHEIFPKRESLGRP